MGEGEGHLFEEGNFFKFWPIGGALIQRGCLFEGGGGKANSRIYSITYKI